MCDLCRGAALEAGVCLGEPTWVGPMGDPAAERNTIAECPQSRAENACKEILEKADSWAAVIVMGIWKK